MRYSLSMQDGWAASVRLSLQPPENTGAVGLEERHFQDGAG